MDDNTLYDALQSNIGRIVALFTPLLTVVVTAAAYWLQNVIGIDMQDHVAAVVAFIATTGTSVLASALVWLHNRGNWEQKALDAHTLLLAAQGEVQRDLAVSPDIDR